MVHLFQGRLRIAKLVSQVPKVDDSDVCVSQVVEASERMPDGDALPYRQAVQPLGHFAALWELLTRSVYLD